MTYLLITIGLILSMLIYIRVARKLNIVDCPNDRSSHLVPTLKGGGIIFWFATLFYFLLHIEAAYMFFIAITLVSAVSFADDIKELSVKSRFLVQGIAVTIVFYSLGIFQTQPLWIVTVAYVLFIGILNAYNFMDGINGMTGLYSLVVLCSLCYVNTYITHFVNRDTFFFLMVASIIFLFFNYRKNAILFAGDVGSISIGFAVVYLFTKLIIQTGDITWLLLLTVYGVESVCTILHRIYLRQNILKPHRIHLFQILSNEYGIDQRVVSLFYALAQVAISFTVLSLYDRMDSLYIILLVLIPSIAVHSIKFILMKNRGLSYTRSGIDRGAQ